MNIKLDTTNKTIILNESVNVKELIDWLKDNIKDWKQYDIGLSNNDNRFYIDEDTFRVPQDKYIYPIEITCSSTN